MKIQIEKNEQSVFVDLMGDNHVNNWAVIM